MNIASEQDCENILSNAGYVLHKKSSSLWIIEEPLGGKAKINSFENLREYASGVQVNYKNKISEKKVHNDELKHMNAQEYKKYIRSRRWKLATRVGYASGALIGIISLLASLSGSWSIFVAVWHAALGLTAGFLIAYLIIGFRSLLFFTIASAENSASHKGATKYIIPITIGFIVASVGILIIFLTQT